PVCLVPCCRWTAHKGPPRLGAVCPAWHGATGHPRPGIAPARAAGLRRQRGCRPSTGKAAMSFDLMVFDPGVAPRERAAFMQWYEQQNEWAEDHDYDDPALASPALQRWFADMVQ